MNGVKFQNTIWSINNMSFNIQFKYIFSLYILFKTHVQHIMIIKA